MKIYTVHTQILNKNRKYLDLVLILFTYSIHAVDPLFTLSIHAVNPAVCWSTLVSHMSHVSRHAIRLGEWRDVTIVTSLSQKHYISSIWFIGDQPQLGWSQCKHIIYSRCFRESSGNLYGFLGATIHIVYAKKCEKSLKNDIFRVVLLNENICSTHTDTDWVQKVSRTCIHIIYPPYPSSWPCSELINPTVTNVWFIGDKPQIR